MPTMLDWWLHGWQVFWMRVLACAAKRLFKKLVLYMPDGSAAPMERGGVLLTNDEWYAEQVEKIQYERECLKRTLVLGNQEEKGETQ